VFEDLKELPPLVQPPARESNKPSFRVPTSEMKRTRRQTMTAREISAFDEMFNMIFNAVSQHKADGQFNLDTPDDITIGLGPAKSGTKARREMGDLFGTLRRHSKRLKWTTSTDEELDRKKEEMELCDTDQQLLEWAMREVFGESRKREEVARQAMQQVARGEAVKSMSMPMLQHPAYPHLISILMRTFRDKYRDPHLTLSIFDYARHLSIPSYVFGCTAPAYNELIETRWSCFRDLRGILDALEEMKVNGVQPDNRTRRLAESIRREAGQKALWEEEDELGGGGQVLYMLNQIEALVSRPPAPEPKNSRKAKGSTQKSEKEKPLNAWKHETQDGPGWQFGKWEETYPSSHSPSYR
jgi:Mtf2 family